MSEKVKLVNSEEIELSRKRDASLEKKQKLQYYFKYKGQKRRVDYVLAVTNDKDDENEENRRNYLKQLKSKRLIVSKPVKSQDGQVTFWLLHARFDLLCDTAEDLNIRLPTVPNDIDITLWYESKLLEKLLKWWHSINPFDITQSYFEEPRIFFSDTFNKNRLSEFHNGDNKEKLFTQTERSRLVAYILESTPFSAEDDKQSDGGSEDRYVLGKTSLIDLGVFDAAYPCHDGSLLEDISKQEPTNVRQKLQKEWANFGKLLKYQPLNAIKEYFGVKTAFYYAWIGFYTAYLIPAAVIGVLCFFFGALSNLWYKPIEDYCSPPDPSVYYMCPLCDKLCSYFYLKDFSCLYAKITHCFDNDGTALFAIFMSIWSIFYLEFWKRKQWSLSYKWHTLNYSEEEVVRPQYSAIVKRLRINPITGKKEPLMTNKEKFLRITGTISVVIFFVALVIAALIGVIVYRAAVFGILLSTGDSLRQNSKLVVTATAALINLVVINVLKLIYKRLAVKMTDWENPRTRSQYEKSFTLKMFWFQFCNTYASVFYVAFFKNEFFVGWPGHYERFGKDGDYRFEGCSAQGCFLELCIQLIVLMVGQQFFGNVVDILIPALKKYYNIWKHGIEKIEELPIWESDYQLSSQEDLALFWEFQEVVIQYGFVVMFVAAFPLAPLIALITNLVEIRIDAINMIKTYRRPVAYKSQGIGVWYDIMITLTTIAILVNGFVLAFTSDFIPRVVYRHQISPDGSLNGYVNWTLSYFNVKDFKPQEKPENPLQNVIEESPTCRYPGFHNPEAPYGYSYIHWEIMAMRLVFAFLFQWTVSIAGRALTWIIPDRPQKLDIKIKREEYLAREALREYKLRIGHRKPDIESSESEESDDLERTVYDKKSHKGRNRSHSGGKRKRTSSGGKRKLDDSKKSDDKLNSGDDTQADIKRSNPSDRSNGTHANEYSDDYLNQML